MKKIIAFTLLLALAVTTLASCDSKPVTPNNTIVADKSISQQVLEELCSEKYEGRLIGTQGNKEAENYLSSLMEDMGLTPYSNNDYTMEYTQLVADPNKQNTKVIITNNDNSKTELIHGKDFYTNAASKAIDVDKELSFDGKNLDKSIPVLKENEINTDENEVIFKVFDPPHLVVGTPLIQNNFTINISSEIYDKMKKDGAKSAKITVDYAGEEVPLNNIYGRIKGKLHTKNVVVLTAHFDHVGKQGDFLFNGIIDNASGTAVLMSVADNLKKSVKEGELDYDIVIAAVNSEETNTLMGVYEGSNVLANYIAKNYDSVLNINIDCVGSKAGDILSMGYVTDLNKTLSDAFRVKLSEANISFDENTYAKSDHSSFENMGFPAFSIGSTSNMEVFHTNMVKLSDIDFKMLEKLSELIADFTVEMTPVFKSYEGLKEQLSENEDKFYEEIYLQLEKIPMKYDEQVYIKINNDYVLCQFNGKFNSIEEVEKVFPDIGIPLKLGEYNFSEAAFSLFSSTGGRMFAYTSIVDKSALPPDIVIGKPFKIDESIKAEIKKENISRVQLDYSSESSKLLIITAKTDKLTEPQPSELVEKIDGEKYKNFSLVSITSGKTFNRIELVQADFTSRIIISDKDGMTKGFTKEEMIKIIDELLL